MTSTCLNYSSIWILAGCFIFEAPCKSVRIIQAVTEEVGLVIKPLNSPVLTASQAQYCLSQSRQLRNSAKSFNSLPFIYSKIKRAFMLCFVNHSPQEIFVAGPITSRS